MQGNWGWWDGEGGGREVCDPAFVWTGVHGGSNHDHGAGVGAGAGGDGDGAVPAGFGELMALIGAAGYAGYISYGAVARRSVGTVEYVLLLGVFGALLLGALAVLAEQQPAARGVELLGWCNSHSFPPRVLLTLWFSN